MSNAVSVIDVRTIAPFERHARIFGQLDALAAGQALQIVNDHDPVPLHRQLDARAPGQFQWTYLQAGPDLWQIEIAKKAAQTQAAAGAEDSCCSGGACCG
ncbi:MAG: DUF2249 domain-containing protein [Comamonadaceae bacterium]|nr:DUF2249 domain-containing protein [Pseudomonadota bacterium]MBS0607843.1 DUF2249 domain-containing protein [Pseudomonadota bacterium]MDE2413926.1 DUF2249 domain-containing protein [Comamonadaceae bacterium]